MIGARMMVPDRTLAGGIDQSVPENMGIVHRALLWELWDVASTGGIGGRAARSLIERLTSHFSREEELVQSIYDLARPDPPEEAAGTEIEDVVVMTAYIQAEVRDLRQEHEEFRLDIDELAEAAEAAYDQRLYDLALSLRAHLDIEEEVHFPAASLIGKCLSGAVFTGCQA